MGLDIYFNKVKTKELKSFRKINFLVRFFKDKGMDVEHQHPIWVDKEDCEKLISLCTQVLSDHFKAKELLPTMSGFFFGSTDYDEHYFSNVKAVKDWVQDILLPQFDSLADNEYIQFAIWY